MARNRLPWTITDESHVHTFTSHEKCDDIITILFGFHSDELLKNENQKSVRIIHSVGLLV